jgi:hypothetical protein
MKNKVLKITFCLTIIFLFLGLSVIIVNANYIKNKDIVFKNLIKSPETFDMLIFVSPQYKEDLEIISAIKAYMSVLKRDIGWNSKIIKVSDENNDYKLIDFKIENFFSDYKIKACLMVGEDLDTPLAGDTDYMEKPSIVPWSTIGGTSSYKECDQGIISNCFKLDICISLIYPTNQEKYNTKKSKIISAFEKFSRNRDKNFLENINVFESSDINTYSKNIYMNLEKISILNYKENPSEMDSEKSFNVYNSMYFIHGHSNPSGTIINNYENTWFSAEEIDNINTPFFGADGCYTCGWWSDKLDNNKLDPSIKGTWYGEKILTSKHVKVMALGLLSQNGYEDPVSFIENVLPNLSEGKTLAESMIGQEFTGDFVVYGDPSFYFTI